MRTRAPRGAAEFEQLGDLLAGAFFPGYPEWRGRFLRDARKDPGVKPEFVRTIRRGGRIVAHVGIFEKPIRLGRALFRMGGIGAVACEKAYRRHGLAAVCMEDALAVMRRDGIPLSFLLCGIERYYTRFGYVDCWPQCALRLPVRELAGLHNPFATRAGRPADMEALARLYNSAAAGTPCSVVRDRERFAYAAGRLGLLEPAKDAPGGSIHIFHPIRRPREARAYLVWKDGGFWEAGMVPGDTEACVAVLAWMRDRRKEAGEKQLELRHLVPAHPLWAFARRFRHVGESGLQWTSGGMGLILDVEDFLKEFRPELEARLSAAGLEAECHLHLAVDGQMHSLILNRAHHLALAALGSRAVLSARVECSRPALLQMAVGTLPFEVLPGVKVEGERAVLRAVFPEATPGIYRLDGF